MKSSNNLAELMQLDTGIKDKDGGGGGPALTDVNISIVLNGYIINFIYEDESMDTYVETDFDQVLKLIRSHH